MHNGAEAFFRHVVGVKGRKKHRKKNIFYEATAGLPPLTVIAQYPGQDYKALFQTDSFSEGYAIKQLVFRDEQNTDYPLRFVPGQLAADFARFLNEHKEKKLRIIATHFDASNPAEEQEIETVCADYLKGTKRSEPLIPQAGDRVEAEMRAAISIPYLRAIAKIAFHYVLAHFPFTGFEFQFDDIKRFIFSGDQHERFVRSMQEPFIEQLKDPRAVVNRWCHLLSAQYDYNSVEARMQFFAGPQAQPLVWQVKVGLSPSRVVGTCAKGFIYSYYDKPDKEGYIGAKLALQLAKP